MSQKRCVHCGRMIDIDFQYCPFCGKPCVIRFENSGGRGHSGNTPDGHNQPDDDDGNRRGWGWLIGVIAFLVLMALGGVVWYLYDLHRQSVDEELAHNARLDSIEASHREMARLDSLRRDSIEWNNFRSHDMAIFGLRGHVKNVRYYGDQVCFHLRMINGATIGFNMDGRFEDPTGIYWAVRDDCFGERDGSGRFTQVKTASTGLMLRYNWGETGLTGIEWRDSLSIGREEYVYNGDNVTRINITTTRAGLRANTAVTLRYADYDEVGNWTRCQWTGHRTVERDSLARGLDSIKTSPRETASSGTITRTITYHNR